MALSNSYQHALEGYKEGALTAKKLGGRGREPPVTLRCITKCSVPTIFYDAQMKLEGASEYALASMRKKLPPLSVISPSFASIPTHPRARSVWYRLNRKSTLEIDQDVL
jgi:hypothetical protein